MRLRCTSARCGCNSTGSLLATATVTDLYAIQGHFRYVTIAPITLLAGQSYEVAGVSNEDNYTWSDPGFATDPAISLISQNGGTDRWLLTGTTTFLNGSNSSTNLGGADGYWGPMYISIRLGSPGRPSQRRGS